MSKPDPEPPALLREEWDFSEVPERELEACFSWECAREWPSFYTDAWTYIASLAQKIHTGIRIQFAPPDLDQGTNVKEAQKLLDSGFNNDALPWCLLAPQDREDATELKNPGLSQIRPEHIGSYISELTAQRPYNAAFWVNWNETDNRLLNDFAAWLRAHRTQVPRENRGSNTRDRLKMIGAMRLLHNMKWSEADLLSRTVLGLPLYGKRPSWERARKGALESFREHFFVDWTKFENPPYPKSYPKAFAKMTLPSKANNV